jgi:sugar phosphate isomerase/epimerase
MRGLTAAHYSNILYRAGLKSVELSGGKPSLGVREELLILKRQMNLQIHNYYPPPELPFVFNLASQDLAINKRSISHVKEAMRLAVDIDNPTYSFHAGFLIDPNPEELGQSISGRRLIDRALGLKHFTNNVLELAYEADKLGVELLVENNVLTPANLKNFGQDPLLCTNPKEINFFMGQMPHNVSLLMDLAHLKVSGKALGFCPHEAHESVRSHIGAYHLSDNNGNVDSNNVIDDKSWFWDILKPNLKFYTLEVYGQNPDDLLKQKILLETKLLRMQE